LPVYLNVLLLFLYFSEEYLTHLSVVLIPGESFDCARHENNSSMTLFS
jgi:hypothetical protein